MNKSQSNVKKNGVYVLLLRNNLYRSIHRYMPGMRVYRVRSAWQAVKPVLCLFNRDLPSGSHSFTSKVGALSCEALCEFLCGIVCNFYCFPQIYQ